MIDRRDLMRSAALATAGLAAAGFGADALAQAGLAFGPAAPFSFDALKEDVRRRARSAYAAPQLPDAEVLDRIGYAEHGEIRYKPDLAIWANGPSLFPLTFFHLGRFFRKPVRMLVVEGGQAREVLYDAAYFDMPETSPARALPKNVGFAGFRFQERRDGGLDWKKNDWVAFLGASYFRTIGENHQYGLSARGLAVDTVVEGKPEEFPDFTRFWFETPGPGSDTVVVYGLLDGPSVVGAYRFRMKREEKVTIDVDSMIVPRREITRLGIAPLTSMYWYSETAKPTMVDWRPEVHDSDGLAMWTGGGERIWRPLNNPPRTSVSTFSDANPRGFGLMQRDRDFDHYLDGVHFERRPSLWIEPKGEWGKGSVQLVENPTDDEIHDNIVAFWAPAETAPVGRELAFAFRMVWAADAPDPGPLARCIATRLGNGQQGPGRPRSLRKFLVEFAGDVLKDMPAGSAPVPIVTASRGTVSGLRTEAVPSHGKGNWRISFDLLPEGDEPVDIRCYLRGADEKVLSETWLYQYHPVAT